MREELCQRRAVECPKDESMVGKRGCRERHLVPR